MHRSSAHGPSCLFNQDGRSSVLSQPPSPEIDVTPDRRFRPEDVYPPHFSPEDIEVPWGECVYLACPGSERKCPKCNVHVAHSDCLVIAIDGACSNNGRDKARSVIGVFHGYDCDFNVSETLDGFDRQTSQIAELEACTRALCDATSIREGWEMADDHLGAIVIKSDSEYVVRGLTEWLPKWKKNGWKNARGGPVANSTHFRRIERLIEQLEEEEVSVEFWLVPREQNKMADSLATFALGGKGTEPR